MSGKELIKKAILTDENIVKLKIDDYTFTIWRIHIPENIVTKFTNELSRVVNIILQNGVKIIQVNDLPLNINNNVSNNEWWLKLDKTIELNISQNYKDYTIQELLVKSLMEYYDDDNRIFQLHASQRKVINKSIEKIITENFYKRLNGADATITLNPFHDKHSKIIKLLYKMPAHFYHDNETIKNFTYHVMENKEFYNNFIQMQEIKSVPHEKLNSPFNQFMELNNNFFTSVENFTTEHTFQNTYNFYKRIEKCNISLYNITVLQAIKIYTTISLATDEDYNDYLKNTTIDEESYARASKKFHKNSTMSNTNQLTFHFTKSLKINEYASFTNAVLKDVKDNDISAITNLLLNFRLLTNDYLYYLLKVYKGYENFEIIDFIKRLGKILKEEEDNKIYEKLSNNLKTMVESYDENVPIEWCIELSDESDAYPIIFEQRNNIPQIFNSNKLNFIPITQSIDQLK